MCVTLSCTTGLLQTTAAWITRGKTRSGDRYDGYNEGCSSRVNNVFLFPFLLSLDQETLAQASHWLCEGTFNATIPAKL